MKWGRGQNRANHGSVPAWGTSSSNRGLGSGKNLCRTHDKTVITSGSGSCRSRHGSGGNGGGSNGGGRRAKVGTTGRGRIRLPHSGPEAMSSTRLYHGWAGEGEEMERMGGGGFP